MDIFVNDITLSFLGWFLASLVSFLLGLLLGYLLWYKYRNMVAGLEADLKKEHDRFVDLETKYASLKYQHDELEKDKKALQDSLNRCEGDKVMIQGMLNELKGSKTDSGVITGTGTGDTDSKTDTKKPAPPKSMGTIFKPHNLQIVEGIGPKIEGLLQKAGINNWKDLAGAEETRLRQILDDAGPRYRIHNPGRWAEEAGMALAGKWDELILFQKTEDPGGNQTPSKVEKLAAKVLGFSSTNPDDLKVVEGIGPKIEQLLKDAGIKNWSDLAAASTQQLEAILAEAGDRYRLATPETWPKQAELATAGKWAELNSYQEFLQGGKDPGK